MLADASGFENPENVGWLAEVQQAPAALPKNTPRLAPLIDDSATLDEWRNTRKQIRKRWLNYLGPLATAKRVTPNLKVIKETRSEGVVLQLVEYEVTSDEKAQAYLLKPSMLKGKAAGVVVFHSTVDHSIHQPAGVEGTPEKAFGWKLAKLGYVTFCPRNFLWPTNDRIDAVAQTAKFQKEFPKSKGMAKMLFDATLAVDILSQQPEVDSDRLGAMGHSLGAKEVLYVAAFDQRVKVAVSSEGGIGTKFSNWNAPWYLGPEFDNFPHEHHEVLAMIAPRPFLLVGGDSADGARSWPFIESVLPIYKFYGDSPPLGLFNHGRGHSVPPVSEKRIYEWFETYLPPAR